MLAPTVNPFTRLVPGFWAPTSATWVLDNRACAIRVISGPPSAHRIEYWVPDAEGNPYLVLAAALASGLHGIKEKINPLEKSDGNAHEKQMPEHLHFPSTLWDAAGLLCHSDVANNWFGKAFVDHFSSSREWEERENRRAITDWQLNRYFKLI